ncbi:polysaccharide pyruvyl transferase CsaB [Thermosynechococcaceae cyanobacterium BACA0444]|uniref:Polysaccharide pyruvyl transferase CsaB n=1 Tax=Pseudocalidococcus azoricus BACA0444 TaxID=2918990 RepID=A0AAE4FSI3_9CYAN|nr:polysaccharide pyruvyl transferase CsaB [Pseudocalidococcus azoricus]MDS3860754.1 polysaccharide pyruvyl transferase CsaB [Pseudocalidococcus azoricus BACA0444]
MGNVKAHRPVLLCGYYGFGNGGDEALLAVLLQLLPADVTPIVLSANVSETQALHRVKAVDRRQLGKLLQTIRQCQGFIWGGGSLMQDATSAISPLYYGGLMLWAQLWGLKTVAWAQGIGPLTRPFSQWWTAWLLSRCSVVTVRDSQSAAWLQKRQVPSAQAPDPVWALTTIAYSEELPERRVAICLRPHSSLTSAGLSRLTEALIDFQKATDTFILLVPFQKSKDVPLATLLQAHLPKVSQTVYLENPQQLKGLFETVQMTIAMRLHALIMAAAAGSKCFALSYDPKVQVLAQELTLPHWILPDLPNTASEMTQAWLDLYSYGQALSPQRIQGICQATKTHQKALNIF